MKKSTHKDILMATRSHFHVFQSFQSLLKTSSKTNPIDPWSIHTPCHGKRVYEWFAFEVLQGFGVWFQPIFKSPSAQGGYHSRPEALDFAEAMKEVKAGAASNGSPIMKRWIDKVMLEAEDY